MMQLKSALLLSGCAWLVAAPLLATASSVHHAEHGVAAGTLGAKHRRTDLKEVHEEQGGHGEGQRREGPEEPSLPESSYHCWHEGTAEEENKFTELGPEQYISTIRNASREISTFLITRVSCAE